MADHGRTLGSVLLLRTGKAQADIATEVGVSTVSVCHWCSGQKRPGPRFKKELRRLYGVPEDAWTKKPDDQAPASAPPTIPPPAVPNANDPLGMANQLRTMAESMMQDLNAPDAATTANERAKVMRSLIGIIDQLAKLTGQHSIERQLFALPLWARIKAEIRDGLRPYPDAARALADRLERLER